MPRSKLSSTLLTLVALASMLGAAMPSIAADSPATLAELASAALVNHEAMARAESNLRRADADIKLSTSILMPRLDLNGTYTRYANEVAIDLGGGEAFVIQPANDWRWSADLNQTIFTGLRDWRARDVAKLNRDIAELGRHTTAANVVLEVAHAFFAAVTAEQQLSVANTAHELISAQLRVAERRHEVGEVTLADVARWRSEVAAARQNQVIAEGENELAHRSLARLAGTPELGKLTPMGPVPVPIGDDQTLVKQALDQRLEMKAINTQLEAAGLMIKIEKGNWLPSADAHLSYNQQKADFPSQDWAALAVTLKVPIYDGGLTAARVAQAKEDQREIELLYSEATKLISEQVDLAAISHRAAEAALEATSERRTAAREAQRQVERAYRAGEASATDLLDTTTELTDAETANIIARWTRELQAIALRHAVGVAPLPDLELNPKQEEDNES